MNPTRSTPIPEIFVLWHPECPLGEKLARRIHAWLRPGNGLGPQVFYRSLPAPEAPAKGLPTALPGETRNAGEASPTARPKVSNLQIVLLLIDEHMVADASWRHWLGELANAKSPPRRKMMPVALDATAYNMPPGLRELNYLRPTGLPLPAGDRGDGPAFEGVARSLLKQLTEAMCRVMLARAEGEQPAAEPVLDGDESLLPKVKIFLSHAKVDGTTPARRLRDYIYSQTQLAAFYDENDIALGSRFGRAIQADLGSPDTAALIAIRSARYASRPWCRRELSLFRRPRAEGPGANGVERWRLYPSLVVEAMEGGRLSAGIPELGNTPIIRWSDEGENLEELIVTSVIRDVMLASFHSAVGASIPPKKGSNRIVINWLPDPTTLLGIPAVNGQNELDIVHPGRGLSGLELDTLFEFFPHVTFHSFEGVLS